MIFQEFFVQDNKMIAPGIHRLRFQAGPMASQAQPGQFVMVRPSGTIEPLLPRPFSIHRVYGEHIDLLFKVLGRGTLQLAALKKGDLLEVRGPLGQGFVFHRDQEPILVAGGMGVAPLLYLAEAWEKTSSTPLKKHPKLFIGARTKAELLGLTAFEAAGVEVMACTEDGSFGEKGLVTRLLERKLKKSSPNTMVFACGPTPMLKAVRTWVVGKGLAAQLSLETHMACGLGACLGCVVARKNDQGVTYVNVCQQGPVFDAREVLWDE